MEKKYRKIVQVKPVLMYREDIIELYNLVSVQGGEEKSLDIEYKNKEESVIVKDIDSLSSISDLPPTSYMVFTVCIWKDHNIVSGFTGFFNHNNISYQLHSENEIWFLGTESKLKKFFKAKKPWYSLIQRFSPFFSSVAVILSFQHASNLVKGDEVVAGIFWFGVTVLILTIMTLMFYQKIFPYVWISFSGKNDRKFSYKKWTFIVSILALIVTSVSGLFLPMFEN